MNYKIDKINKLMLKARDLAIRLPQKLWVDDNIKQIAFIPKWTKFELKFNRYAVDTQEEFDDVRLNANADFKFINSQYHVLVYLWDTNTIWLCIKNHENTSRTDWRDKQRIKNELCGTQCEGIELYPLESKLVDSANSFHLFVGRPNVSRNLGWSSRDVIDEDELKVIMPTAKQRKFEEHHNAKGCNEEGIVWKLYNEIQELYSTQDQKLRQHKDSYQHEK